MKISHLIKDNVQSLADMEMRETGKPISAARGAVSSAARYFEFYAGVADKIQGTTVPLGEGYIDFTLREALGVTAHILPWNVPLNMLARAVWPRHWRPAARRLSNGGANATRRLATG